MSNFYQGAERDVIKFTPLQSGYCRLPGANCSGKLGLTDAELVSAFY
jgi:hypothetical protein